MNSCEILAPAGGREQLEAAVRANADAVYLGYGSFNARRNAKNFTLEELTDAVKYCHAHGVKVHAALNTLITDGELSTAYEDIKSMVGAGVDAVIVQDLGIARMIRECFPELEMHASTQMTVHNVAGARELEALGFKRAVLSRELSFDEIKRICENTYIDIEVFIHGALCMCMSGGCYLSSILGQRSGNRGLCAQPCRLDFKLNGREYALSLKDMCHIEYINKLKDAGVVSFKIEGRMKRPEYVYASVTACRDALLGKKPDIEGLKKIFSRSGFTDGYYTGKRTLDMFGYRRKEDVVAAEGVLRDISQKYKNEVQNVPVTVKAEFFGEKPVAVTVSDGTNTVTVKGEIPENAVNRETESEDIKKQLSKTGGTPYYIKEIEVCIDGGLSYPLSSLNALRRSALEALTQKRTEVRAQRVLPFNISREQNEKNNTIALRVSNADQLERITEDVPVIIPIDKIDDRVSRFSNVIAEIPSLIFPFDEEKIRDVKIECAFCDSIGSIRIAKEFGFVPIAGWGMNVMNSNSVYTLRDMGVVSCVASFEASRKNIENLSNPIPVGIIGYGHLPLMRMRACPAQGKNGCGGCTGINTLTDRKNIDFTLLCNNKKYVTLLNSLPLYVGDKKIQADFHILYFNTESASQVNKIYNIYKNGQEPDFARTNGLYFKNLM